MSGSRSFLLAVLTALPLTAAAAEPGDILGSFLNPTPEFRDRFGLASASIGDDYVLIGAPRADDLAPDAGAVYLFHRDGALVKTIYSPTPDEGDWFGSAVASWGNYIVVGANRDDTWSADAGSAYIFDLQGRLISTLFSPNPQAFSNFGSQVAVAGDRIVVSAYRERVNDVVDAGAAYVFTPTGTLTQRLTSPRVTESSLFGWSLAADQDSIVIGATGDSLYGANAGAVFEYSPTGEYSREIISPSPVAGDNFGAAIALEGDRIFVSAPLDDTAGEDLGSVFAFDHGGKWTNTVVNPSTTPGDGFGSILAATPSGLAVAAPAYQNGFFASGAVQIFDAFGAHLDTVISPNTGLYNSFGTSLTSVGNDFVATDPNANGGANTAGIAYLIAGPELMIPGDTNGDLRVDLTDYAALRTNFGREGTRKDGDFTGDGAIRLDDFEILKANFGVDASHSVPEPTAAWLLLSLAGVFSLFRRR